MYRMCTALHLLASQCVDYRGVLGAFAVPFDLVVLYCSIYLHVC